MLWKVLWGLQGSAVPDSRGSWLGEHQLSVPSWPQPDLPASPRTGMSHTKVAILAGIAQGMCVQRVTDTAHLPHLTSPLQTCLFVLSTGEDKD